MLRLVDAAPKTLVDVDFGTVLDQMKNYYGVTAEGPDIPEFKLVGEQFVAVATNQPFNFLAKGLLCEKFTVYGARVP